MIQLMYKANCLHVLQPYNCWMQIIRTGKRQSINKCKERKRRSKKKTVVCRSNVIVVQPVLFFVFVSIIIIIIVLLHGISLLFAQWHFQFMFFVHLEHRQRSTYNNLNQLKWKTKKKDVYEWLNCTNAGEFLQKKMRTRQLKLKTHDMPEVTPETISYKIESTSRWLDPKKFRTFTFNKICYNRELT